MFKEGLQYAASSQLFWWTLKINCIFNDFIEIVQELYEKRFEFQVLVGMHQVLRSLVYDA